MYEVVLLNLNILKWTEFFHTHLYIYIFIKITTSVKLRCVLEELGQNLRVLIKGNYICGRDFKTEASKVNMRGIQSTSTSLHIVELPT